MTLTYDNLSAYLMDVRPKTQSVAIVECGEPLVELDPRIRRFAPHAYQSVGAPYGKSSPFHVRKSIAEKLARIEKALFTHKLQLQLFDGYRPLAVQVYMVDRTYGDLRSRPAFASLSNDEVYDEVFKLFAPPEPDLSKPPPHSTGAAVDLTLTDLEGNLIDMGSEIDEAGPAQLPHYFEETNSSVHRNRMILRDAMTGEGFIALEHEWWHFSFGDQFWAMKKSTESGAKVNAIYGRVEVE